MIYLTSDTHFWHNNILKYDSISRPFGSIEEMNEIIIKNWNDTVTPEDEIYVLGDFFMGEVNKIDNILPRLNGKIHLIQGNHDSPKRIAKYAEYGIDVQKLEYITYKGRFFILCHFPNDNKEFIELITKNNSEVIWCYGHVHHNAPKGYVNGTYHVGLDTNDLKPISIQQIWEEAWPEEIMTEEIKAYKQEHEKD